METGYIDLVNTSFRNAGLVFPERWYRRAWDRWRAAPAYQPTGRGSVVARNAIAAFLTGDGLHTTADQLVLTAGSSVSYDLIFRLLRNRRKRGRSRRSSDTIALPVPGYPLFEDIARAAGLRPLPYTLTPSTGFDLEPLDLCTALSADPVALVLISPNNPTGAIYSADTLRAVLETCAVSDTPIISDEVFSAYRQPGTGLPRIAAIANDVTVPAAGSVPPSQPPIFSLNGLSKLCAAPEVKLGWIAVHGEVERVAELVDELDTIHDTYLTVSGFAEAAGEVFLSDEATLDRQSPTERIAEMRALLHGGLRSIDGIVVTALPPPRCGGIHTTVRLDANLCAQRFNTVYDAEIARRILHEGGVHVHPGYLYGLNRDTTGVIDPFFVLTCLNKQATTEEALGLITRVLHG